MTIYEDQEYKETTAMSKVNKKMIEQIVKEELDNILNEMFFDKQTGKSLGATGDLRLMAVKSDVTEYTLEQLREIARRHFSLQKVSDRLTGNSARQVNDLVPKLAAALKAMTEFHEYVKYLEEKSDSFGK